MNAVENAVPTIDTVLSSIPARAASRRSGRWLLYGINMAPELTGIGKYTGEMAARLAARGHEVTVVTAYPYYPHWKLDPVRPNWRWSTETWQGVRIIRCPIWVPEQPNVRTRILHLLSFALSSCPAILYAALRYRPETLFIVEPTSLATPMGLVAARLTGAETWLHVQDIELGAAINVGLIDRGALAKTARSFYGWTLRNFDRVTTLSSRMRTALASMGRSEEAIDLFPNWVDAEIYKPAGESALREELGVRPDDFVALYSGAMGEKQGIESLLDVARALADEPQIKLIICGAGPAREKFKQEQQNHRNILLLDPQPHQRFVELLFLADCHLLPQKEGVTHYVMPSKLGPMLISKKPIIAQADDNCEVAVAVRAAGGVVIGPSDHAAMSRSILTLYRRTRLPPQTPVARAVPHLPLQYP